MFLRPGEEWALFLNAYYRTVLSINSTVACKYKMYFARGLSLLLGVLIIIIHVTLYHGFSFELQCRQSDTPLFTSIYCNVVAEFY